MLRYTITWFTLFLLLLLITGFPCREKKKRHAEGVITYALELSTPLFETKDELKMVITFKDHLVREEIKGSGRFFTSYPVISNGKTSTQLVREIGKKVVREIKKMPQQPADFEVLYTDSVKEIAGYPCKQAIITDKEGKQHLVWYAPGLMFKGKESLRLTFYYNDIPGMLMEFEKGGEDLTYKYVAEKVELKETDPALFRVPDEYEKITPDQFKQWSNER